MVAVVSLATKAPHRCMVLDHVLWHGTSWVSRDIRSGQLLVNRSHHFQRGIYVRLGKTFCVVRDNLEIDVIIMNCTLQV